MKHRVFLGILLTSTFLSQLIYIAPAFAAPTWTATSPRDSFNRSDMVPDYDLEFVSASIFDNSQDQIYFYLHFTNKPRVDMFNDGKSWAFVGLDYDRDGTSDIRLELFNKLLRSDRTSVQGDVYDARTKTFPSCDTDVFTNIAEDRWWIGFSVSRDCIKLPSMFGIQGYSDYLQGDDVAFDYAPSEHFIVSLPGSTNSGASSGTNYQIPSNIANASTSLGNFSSPPSNLTLLAQKISPSVVTVYCGNGKGSGWAIKADLSSSLKAAGFASYVVTNHHVIEDCIRSKAVRLQLSSGTIVAGTLVSWNENSDVAGIATTQMIESLEWIGATPQQGWWVGVIGSPGALVGVLTTGIISSLNADAGTFTFTAPINPGNSGGPVFDSTGRVLGLATSKNLLSNGVLAEGSGNAHGVPLLCTSVINCAIEKRPWGATSKFSGPSSSDLELAAKAEAEAKAKADAEAKARAEAEARAKADAEALLAMEKKLRDEKTRQCLDLNGELAVQKFSLESAKATYPRSVKSLQTLIEVSPKELDCSNVDLSLIDAQLSNHRKIISVFQTSVSDSIAAAKFLATRPFTITCTKGKVIRKLKGTNPTCPKGFKQK